MERKGGRLADMSTVNLIDQITRAAKDRGEATPEDLEDMSTSQLLSLWDTLVGTSQDPFDWTDLEEDARIEAIQAHRDEGGRLHPHRRGAPMSRAP